MNTDITRIKARVGCSSISFRHLQLPGALDQIQALGFTALDIGVLPGFCPHIDLSGWREQDTQALAADLAGRRLRLSSLNVNVAGLAVRDARESLEFLEMTVKVGAGLGARSITLPVGPSVPAENWREAAESVARCARHLAGKAHEAGLRISLEAPHTGALASNYEESRRLFELVNDERVGCTFDTSHGQFNDPRPVAEGLKAVGANIIHVHLRDVLGQSFGVTPGKGICDYLPFFQALVNSGYQGDFNLEMECGPAVAEAEVRFARDYLAAVLEGKPLPPEFAAWRTPRRRLEAKARQVMRNPKAYLTSRPWYGAIRPLARPFVRGARAVVPASYYRYESGWRKRYTTNKTLGINLERKPPHLPAGVKAKRVAIVGCGTVGRYMHGPSFANLAGVELVGVCDTNPEAAAVAGEEFGCAAFTDLAELVSQARPDLAANCTSETAHSTTSLYLLERGVDVFCEKIMAESLASGELMVRRATEGGRVLGVNFNWRFQPGIAKIRQIKEAGTLGELCLLRFMCHAHVWHHVLDLVNYLGGKTVSVAAQVRLDPLSEDDRPWRRFADELLYLPGVYANATIETAEGIGASITSSSLWQPIGCLLNLDAVFRRGVISLSGVNSRDALGILTCDQKDLDLHLGTSAAGEPQDYSVTFKRSIEAFMEAYLQGKRPPTNGEDGLFTMRLEQAVVESSKTGRTVRLE